MSVPHYSHVSAPWNRKSHTYPLHIQGRFNIIQHSVYAKSWSQHQCHYKYPGSAHMLHTQGRLNTINHSVYTESWSRHQYHYKYPVGALLLHSQGRFNNIHCSVCTESWSQHQCHYTYPITTYTQGSFNTIQHSVGCMQNPVHYNLLYHSLRQL